MDFTDKKFLEEHKDFVLKVKTKHEDGTTQLRRIRLPWIANQQKGTLSYSELVGLVLTSAFPDGSQKDYQVVFTYIDEDEEEVTMGSAFELADAIEQYTEEKLLRITTEVKPKASLGAPDSTAGMGQNAASAESIAHHRRGNATSQVTPSRPPLNPALEYVANALSTAVTHLEVRLASLEMPPRTGDAPRTAAETVVRVPEAPTTHGPHVVTTGDVSETGNTKAEKLSPPEKAASDVQLHPFIHGRHTCDSCSVSPIVGKRYRATNQLNYDLCEACFSNYTGSEVQFETEELDRDRPFQERWHKSYQTISKKNNKKTASKPSERAEKAVVEPAVGVPEVSTTEEASAATARSESEASNVKTREQSPPVKLVVHPRPFIHGCHKCDSCYISPIVGKRYRATNQLHYDLCEACFSNYNGSELQFETEELDRDRPLQVRWHRNYLSASKKKVKKSAPTSSGSAAKTITKPAVDVPEVSTTEESSAATARSESEARNVKTREGSPPVKLIVHPRPFIHGCHTCDSCSVSPIVGKRYRAMNRSDYDLCEACFSNYTGSELQLKSEELDRDRPFQERWHRNYLSASKEKAKKTAPTSSGSAAKTVTKDAVGVPEVITTEESSATTTRSESEARNVKTREGAPPVKRVAEGHPRLFIHARHTCNSCSISPIVGKRYHAMNRSDYDLCEACFSNYTGSELQLKTEELDRDWPFQERWHRNYLAASKKNAKKTAPTSSGSAAKTVTKDAVGVPEVITTEESSAVTTRSESEARSVKTREGSPPVKHVAEGHPRPFIHGRHTCDSCSISPIVGKRYHAMNRSDYDLCEACFSNYKGSELQLKTEELDRDRPFQEIWLNFYKYVSKKNDVVANGSTTWKAGSGVPGMLQSRSVVPKVDIHTNHTCNHCKITPIVGKRYHATNLPDYDVCEACFPHYAGSSLRFETVELFQDQALQTQRHLQLRLRDPRQT